MRRHLKAWLWRARHAILPERETVQYRQWFKRRIRLRAERLRSDIPPGLFSILTPVWDGSPPRYLAELARSIAAQRLPESVEWIVFNNACRRPELLELLQELVRRRQARVISSETNVGICRGLRQAMEAARYRYIVPVDGDDLLAPDALSLAAASLMGMAYPAAAYSDEDKIAGRGLSQPYFKPDWDPVLVTNSAYMAHLGLIDRNAALACEAYSNPETEGSVDWDLFLRLHAAGHRIEHIPEMLYHWRMHPQSTAEHGDNKTYIAESQRAALRTFVSKQSWSSQCRVEASPLLAGAHFHLRFHFPRYGPIPDLSTATAVHEAMEMVRAVPDNCLFVAIEDPTLVAVDPGWQQEAYGTMLAFPDTVMVGGRIFDRFGRIVSAGDQFGFKGIYGSPHEGLGGNDPGYFGQALKTRSVAALSSKLALIRRGFLMETLQSMPELPSLDTLGIWAGALASVAGHRVIYSPFVSGQEGAGKARTAYRYGRMSRDERARWEQRYAGCYNDRRYYPRPFSLERGFALDLETADQPETGDHQAGAQKPGPTD